MRLFLYVWGLIVCYFWSVGVYDADFYLFQFRWNCLFPCVDCWLVIVALVALVAVRLVGVFWLVGLYWI